MAVALLKTSLSRTFLFAALICFSVTAFLVWQRYTPVTLTFSNFPNSNNSYQVNNPQVLSTLNISDLNIQLPVTSKEVSKGSWPVSSSSLIHVANTPKPGDTGNSVIYGHNWPNLLGSLTKAEIGQKVEIYDDQGQKTDFIITDIQIVKPTQTELLDQTTEPVLTLYTCVGFLDTQRLVIRATKI